MHLKLELHCILQMIFKQERSLNDDIKTGWKIPLIWCILEKKTTLGGCFDTADSATLQQGIDLIRP